MTKGPLPFVAEIAGDLPEGMSFDTFTGVLAGKPTESGQFALTASASDGVNPRVSRNYQLVIAAPGELPAPMMAVDTLTDPPASGTATGDGLFEPGSEATLSATPRPGYRFGNWTEQGQVVGSSPTLNLQVGKVNRALVANFVVSEQPSPMTLPPGNTPGVAFSLQWPLVPEGWILEESPDMSPRSWRPSLRNDKLHNGLHEIEIAAPVDSWRFFRLSKP